MLDKTHARKIAKKLDALMDTSGKAHDLACVYHEGVLIATFGIRRGSRKNLGHGHIASDLHVRQREALDLANCTLSRAAWIEKMRDLGLIEITGHDE